MALGAVQPLAVTSRVPGATVRGEGQICSGGDLSGVPLQSDLAAICSQAEVGLCVRDTEGEALLVAVGGNDEPEGFVSVWEPDAFIHHLYVRNGSRRKGIGGQLLDSLVTRLPRPWRLKCVRANDVALAFYLDRGWLEVSSGVGEDGPYAVLEKA